MTIHPHSQAAQKHGQRAELKLSPLRTPKRPSANPGGQFYRIEVRPKEQFDVFRVSDLAQKGHLECLLGKRSGSSRFHPVQWLVSKKDAHVAQNGRLIIDHPRTRMVLKQLEIPIVHYEGDFFHAKPKQQKKQHASREHHTNTF
jgi:hypothetical protein